MHVLRVMHLLILGWRLQLHVKLLTKGLQLLHVVVINGDGLLRHWRRLSHLIHVLHCRVMMIHWVLVHLHDT